MAGKNVKFSKQKNDKTVIRENVSTDNKNIIWTFDKIDTDGQFAFNINRNDFDIHQVMDKMIAYSNMTWAAIKHQTHDNGKSKHHTLNVDGFSDEAKKRFEFKQFQDYSDSVFSFALQNKLRIIGIRTGQIFHAVWYDCNHEFYPSKKK